MESRACLFVNRYKRRTKVNPDLQDILKKGIRRLWFIWGSMILSLFVYVKIGPLLEPNTLFLPGDDYFIYILKISLYCISAVLLASSLYVRHLIMTRKSENQESMYIQRAEKTNSHPAVIKYGTAVTISLAFSESVGIFGFVLFLVSHDFQALYTFTAISAIAMIYHRPRMQELQEVVHEMK
jgi:hypothetical protein